MAKAFTGKCRSPTCQYPELQGISCDNFYAEAEESQERTPRPGDICICGCRAQQHTLEETVRATRISCHFPALKALL